MLSAEARAPIVYLWLLFAGTLALALLVAALAPALPYGAHADKAVIAFCAIALVPGAFLLRAHRIARLLVAGELLRMAPEDLPAREGHSFIGYAFPWKPADAERLYRLSAQGFEPPDATQALFGNTLLHGLGVAREEPLFIADAKRTHHMLVLGSPGEGKTRFVELLVRQLIAKDDVVVIVDPKGDARLINLVRQVCHETGRGEDFKLVALPWPGSSVPYNPLTHFATPSEIADRLIGILPPGGGGDSEAFRGFQWGATCAVVQAMYLAGLPITIARVLRYLRDLSSVALALVARRLPDLNPGGKCGDIAKIASIYEAAVARGEIPRLAELDDLLHYLTLDSNYYNKMVASFLPQLERLAAGPRRELLSPEPETTPGEILTWHAIDRQKLVVYFYLGSLHGEESANAVGRMLLLDLQAYIASRYSYDPEDRKQRLSLFVDEAHHLVSKQFLNILAEARGADVAVVLSTQTTAQFESAFGSRAAVDEILTQNFAHIQFQTRNPREAEDFSRLAGDRLLRVAGESYRYEPAFFSSGLSQVDDFRAMHNVSIQYKDAPLVPPWVIATLPTFHYFARIGGRLWKARIPLLTDPWCTFVADIKEGVAA